MNDVDHNLERGRRCYEALAEFSDTQTSWYELRPVQQAAYSTRIVESVVKHFGLQSPVDVPLE